jgi:hypothetical protein
MLPPMAHEHTGDLERAVDDALSEWETAHSNLSIGETSARTIAAAINLAGARIAYQLARIAEKQ